MQFNWTSVIRLHTVKWSISSISNKLFAHSLNVEQFYFAHRENPIKCYHSRPEWTWEQWQWRVTLHSPNLQDWRLTIRCLCVISWTFVGVGVLPLNRNAVGLDDMSYSGHFDPAQKNAIPRWCTGRKWHIPMAVRRGNRVGGNWLMKWDKVIPMVNYRANHRKRVTSELHDSYFRLMTIKHSISKIEWASNDYIIQLSSTSQSSCQESSRQLETRCGRESHIRLRGPSKPRWSLGSREDADKMQ